LYKLIVLTMIGWYNESNSHEYTLVSGENSIIRLTLSVQ
jgi:hypothetical protein